MRICDPERAIEATRPTWIARRATANRRSRLGRRGVIRIRTPPFPILGGCLHSSQRKIKLNHHPAQPPTASFTRALGLRTMRRASYSLPRDLFGLAGRLRRHNTNALERLAREARSAPAWRPFRDYSDRLLDASSI